MKFLLDIQLGGPGLKDTDGVGEKLIEVAGRAASKMGDEGDTGLIRDDDGEAVGKWIYTELGSYELHADDWTMNEMPGGRRCMADLYDSDGDPMYSCTRGRNHRDLHVAGDGSEIEAVWGRI